MKNDFDPASYEEERTDKDDFFKNSDNSPVPEDQRDAFKGLNYYPPSADFIVEARLVRTTNADTIQLPTTKDDLRDSYQVGIFHFAIKGTDVQLPAYRFVGADHPYLFVPFKDATTGVETYGTGRYLDIEIQDSSDVYIIDFNKAYNPWCAYNDGYSCPLVPAANTLAVAIEAGEKTWH
jgi:uncharacterized protein